MQTEQSIMYKGYRIVITKHIGLFGWIVYRGDDACEEADGYRSAKVATSQAKFYVNEQVADDNRGVNLNL